MAAGRDGVVRAVFDAGERFTAACDDAVPQEMICGETTRIDQSALTGLIQKSEGIAVGTPKSGLPVVVESEIVMDTGAVVAVGEPVVEWVGGGEPVVVSEAVQGPSRARDVLIGGFLSLLVMAAWYCATQL